MAIDSIIIFIIELLGVIAFAISGALVAINKGLDIMGILFLTVTTSLGGGVIRDILLGITPPMLFVNPVYTIYAALAITVAVICYVLSRCLHKREIIDRTQKNILLHITDAVGLGFFCVAGADIAITSGFQEYSVLCVFVGCISGFGGSMSRDIIVNEIPIVFRKYIYIIPTIVGTSMYVHVYKFIPHIWAVLIGSSIIIIIRVFAIIFKWNLPTIVDNPTLSKPHI